MRNLFDDLFDGAIYDLNKAEDSMFGPKEIPDGYVRGEDMTRDLIDEMVDEMYDEDFGAEKVRFLI